MKKIVFEENVTKNLMSREFGGCFQSIDFVTSDIKQDYNNGMYVRVCSWDDNNQHELFKHLVGERVRVTIEILD
jgi:hypothetical protein